MPPEQILPWGLASKVTQGTWFSEGQALGPSTQGSGIGSLAGDPRAVEEGI